MSPEKRLEYLGTVSNYTRLEVVGPWQEIIYNERIAGDMYWFVLFFFASSLELGDPTFPENRRQLGVGGLSTGNSTDVGTISNQERRRTHFFFRTASLSTSIAQRLRS